MGTCKKEGPSTGTVKKVPLTALVISLPRAGGSGLSRGKVEHCLWKINVTHFFKAVEKFLFN